MKNYRQQELEALVTCPKLITRPPRRELALERGSWRNDMQLKSARGDESFEVFLRRADTFPENFSIGLMWYPREDPEQICLIRCNGPHGDFLGDLGAPPAHFSHHIHLATERAIAAGEKPEAMANATDEFASFEEAMVFFINRCNIEGAWDYFPHAKPVPLFDRPEDRS